MALVRRECGYFQAASGRVRSPDLRGGFSHELRHPLSSGRELGFTLTAISVTLSFALGLATRVGGALAVWLMIMIAIGGYYDASLLPLWLVAGLMIVCPSGQWFGLDKNLHARYPKSLWFR